MFKLSSSCMTQAWAKWSSRNSIPHFENLKLTLSGHNHNYETEILLKNEMLTVIISPAYMAKGSFFFSPASAKGH